MKLGNLPIGKACLAPCVAPQHLESPQATMDSDDYSCNSMTENKKNTTIMNGPSQLSSPPLTLELDIAHDHNMIDDDDDDDEDENDDEVAEQQQQQEQHQTWNGQQIGSCGPPSAQLVDQVLEMSAALDLSDSSAIMSRIANQSTPVTDKNSCNSPYVTKKRRREPNATSSGENDNSGIQPLKTRTLTRTLSRRPSMHETYDCEPELRGQFIYYLYCFGVLGTSLRIFLGRFFGRDCEFPDTVDDFLSPLSRMICVTATGRTIQRGGALFIDLPANMLGAFVMGLISSLVPENTARSRLPWLRHDHPLQQHAGLHDALKVGFCGCLTSYASWDTQMLVMMEGTGTVLGPQVVPALFGYMLGLVAASGSFITGGRVYEWIYDWSNRPLKRGGRKRRSRSNRGRAEDADEEQPQTSFDTDDSHGVHELEPPTEVKQQSLQIKYRYSSFAHKFVPFVLCAALLVWYGVADGVLHMQFYRQMWASCLLTPLGVHLRWKLATFNGRGLGRNHRLDWVPWGTLASNVIGSVISMLLQAVLIKYLSADQYWLTALAVGAMSGMAGSLSTVSSMAKEIVNLSTIHPTHGKAFIYSCGTVALTLVLGLSVYFPIMRFG